jgi:predicted oxidoreductase (fatty acid repression mutant protein)
MTIRLIKPLTSEEYDLIVQIADKAVEKFPDHFNISRRRTLILDLDNVQKRRPLQLKELLAAADHEHHLQDFAHDIGGIQRHIDRETGELPEWFSPRYEVKDGH